ncbi:hypothetical protein BZG25_08880 [Salinivibrio sp. ML198]|uniref:DUF1289 domain-containing protein n=1 Tax=Salinivibrio sp. ML198 TaxID=1909458 RepID=UPI000988B649|nr:DUF1289 domain-containing protein [Salinivibrio sp. ML198]OOE79669.1 hypothetical protein BZG25_08880 [Salinivibrio sp. ML198]
MLTPCIGHCRREDDICVGCKRTLDEIVRWGKMTDDERESIMAQLPKRPEPTSAVPSYRSRNSFKRRTG